MGFIIEKGKVIKVRSIQQRAKKLILSLHNKPYEDRLAKLGLHSLETERLGGQLKDVFKILKGVYNI